MGILDLEKDGPPPDVISGLRANGYRTGPDGWTRLKGGRTNRLWVFESDGRAFVCKCYVRDAGTPLFPNDARAEAHVLRALVGTGLAPHLCLTLDCASGPALVYRHITDNAQHDPQATAAALARLHDQRPASGLRLLAHDPNALLRQGDAMLRDVDDADTSRLKGLRPGLPDTTAFEQVFLHGDPVPANVLQTNGGPCFIDWQCPAIGDPTEDLALYLSPAMQHLYGGRLLGDAQVAAFLNAYGNGPRAERYRELAPIYHWRMAAYCIWKTNAGDPEYSAAAELEIAMLEQIGQPDRRD